MNKKKYLTCQKPSQKAYFENEKPQAFFCADFNCFEQWAKKQNLAEEIDY